MGRNKNKHKNECNLTTISYKTWIEPLEYIRYENQTIYILIQQENVIAFDYIKIYFVEYIVSYIAEIVESNDLRIEFVR